MCLLFLSQTPSNCQGQPTRTCVKVSMFQREPRHTPQIEPMSKHIHQSQVVRRRQVRIGIRGRIVTVEVRQAIIGTIVSIAGAKRRTKTRNLPPKRGSPLSKSYAKIVIFRYTPYTKYKKPPSAVLRATAEVSVSYWKQVCQRTIIGRTCGARVLARWLRHLRWFQSPCRGSNQRKP